MASYDFKLSDSGGPVRFRLSRAQCLFLAFLCLCLVIVVALLVLLLVMMLDAHAQHHHQDMDKPAAETHSVEEIRASIFANIDPARIAANLEALTERPHVAGTEANKRVADRIEQIWKANGLEDVHQIPYDVLLSYPKWESPNHVYMLGNDGSVLFETTGLSPDLVGNDNSPEASIQWLAWSPEGTVQGEPIYCNFGTVGDFERLEKLFGIRTLQGKIAIMRYGGTFRGDMVHHAYQRGAIGAILYTDPDIKAADGPDHVYPSMDWLPSVGVERGSTLLGHGDPLSPLLPSRKDFHKEKSIEHVKNDPENMPQIPVLPLGYGDVYHIMSRMDGPEVPADWKGGMNITYRVGPGFKPGQQARRLKVEVHSTLEIRTIQNVVGYIWGSEYPDEWVMLGNHYDAWVFGSIDPNSGTAVMAEAARGLAETVRTTGWRPKRTVVFCAWDAEEYGLIGSTEFVEEFADILKERGIVYINVDNISGNKTLHVRAVPTIYRAAVEGAKAVRNPNNRQQTLFDNWLEHAPSRTDWLPEVPEMRIPGGGSDHTMFLNFLGLPVMDFTFHNPERVEYPLYHSRYELPFVNEHITDHNNLAVHKAIGEYFAEMARIFADSPLLPIDPGTFAHRMLANYLEDVRKPIEELFSRFSSATAPAKKQFDNLVQNVHQFMAQAATFEHQIGQIGMDRANLRLRRLDQCFVNPSLGISREEPIKRNVLFSTAKDNFYASSVMAMVHKKIGQLRDAGSEAERQQHSNELALELTVVQQAVRCAVDTLSNAI